MYALEVKTLTITDQSPAFLVILPQGAMGCGEVEGSVQAWDWDIRLGSNPEF